MRRGAALRIPGLRFRIQGLGHRIEGLGDGSRQPVVSKHPSIRQF